MMYVIVAVSLAFVAYLAHDFYQEQLRPLLIPVRANRRNAVRKVRRNRVR